MKLDFLSDPTETFACNPLFGRSPGSGPKLLLDKAIQFGKTRKACLYHLVRVDSFQAELAIQCHAHFHVFEVPDGKVGSEDVR